jgi:hypothetical protein
MSVCLNYVMRSRPRRLSMQVGRQQPKSNYSPRFVKIIRSREEEGEL